MSRQHHWPGSSLQHALKSSDVIRKRRERNRRTRYVQTLLPQRQNNVTPTGSVSPCSMNQYDRGVLKKEAHRAAPPSARWKTPLVSKNSFIAAAISTACVSIAKWPVSRNRTCAFGRSFRKASAPAGMKKGSFLPQIASNGGFAFRKYS